MHEKNKGEGKVFFIMKLMSNSWITSSSSAKLSCIEAGTGVEAGTRVGSDSSGTKEAGTVVEAGTV